MLTISKTLDLPADISTKASAILGIRGSGKTNTGVVIVEGLLEESRPMVVIDPLDVWWGLRSSTGGSRAGFKVVVCGGEHGDLPLAEGDGATLADFVVEHQVPLVLSLRHLRKAAQQRFVTSFAEQLYHRKGETKHRVPLLVVIDEADSFVPQRVGGNEARMVGAIEDLVRRGRSAGIGVLMISQRAASINKDVLTQIELLIAHRHTSPQDRSALKAWIEANDDAGRQTKFLESLSSLSLGEAWFWSPGWLKLFQKVSVRARKTFDSSGTPNEGSASSKPKQFADVDLEAIRGKLAKTIEQSKSDDPKELKRQIVELEKKLKQPQKAAMDQLAIEKAVASAVMARDSEWKKALTERDSLIGSLKGRMVKAATLLHFNGEAVPKTSTPKNVRPSLPVTDKVVTSNAGLTKVQQRIINALAWYETLGNMQPTSTQIGAVALIDPTGGYFSNSVGPLSTNGLINRGSGSLSLTDEGRKLAEPTSEAATIEDYHEVLRNRVRKMKSASNKTIAILNAMIAAHGESLTVEEIGTAVGIDHTGGYFSNSIGPLSTVGLIERNRGVVAPTDILFPKGML